LIEKPWIFGLSEFVSACVERDKKNFKKFVFCAQTHAQMIEIPRLRSGLPLRFSLRI
jgi:hypothetical protein